LKIVLIRIDRFIKKWKIFNPISSIALEVLIFNSFASDVKVFIECICNGLQNFFGFVGRFFLFCDLLIIAMCFN